MVLVLYILMSLRTFIFITVYAIITILPSRITFIFSVQIFEKLHSLGERFLSSFVNFNYQH